MTPVPCDGEGYEVKERGSGYDEDLPTALVEGSVSMAEGWGEGPSRGGIISMHGEVLTTLVLAACLPVEMGCCRQWSWKPG